ncbi:MAG TPA: hypothetical protein PLS03_12195 [Terrimicrobiaceae bacterium]|nr:hypothetical protein [Terrimicrobiaceae bacterium]
MRKKSVKKSARKSAGELIKIHFETEGKEWASFDFPLLLWKKIEADAKRLKVSVGDFLNSHLRAQLGLEAGKAVAK